MGTLAGKVALVTGGSGGIGLASAEELIREGAFVYITGRKKTELDAAANRLGDRCVSIQADISRMEDIDRIYKKIAGDGKTLDVLFANAGGGSFAPLGSITEEQYDATFTTNVKGTLFTVQKSLPHLNDGSSIILNASIASVKGIPGLSVYSAAKAALRSFARVWMMDLRERRIRVNVISPGPIDTPGFRAAAGSTPEDRQRFVKAQASGVPAGRIGEAWEIARAVVFLSGKDSAFINGIELFVDGGVTQN
jgi:NAD(P)-dependent dehydrogenase (short-subunit alcohol dehydrogenase family)